MYELCTGEVKMQQVQLLIYLARVVTDDIIYDTEIRMCTEILKWCLPGTVPSMRIKQWF